MNAAFTIVSRNYLHFAKTLMQSLQQHAPEFERFVIICDERDEATCEAPLYRVLYLDELPIPQESLPFLRYTILELNTAIKPTVFQQLFERFGYEKVVYFDPDIRLYSGLDDLQSRLDRSDVLLTPHLTGPLDDDHHPGEVDILRSGSFNLGFLALRSSSNTRSLLALLANLQYS